MGHFYGIYLWFFFFEGHLRTFLWDTFIGYFCRKFLWDIFIDHFYGILL